VTELVEAATEADGVRPLSEHVLLHLRADGEGSTRNVLLYDGDQLSAYGHLDLADKVAGASAEVVVHPLRRRNGYGRQLVQELAAAVPDGRLRLWAHGERPAAAALALAMGFSRARVLWQMRRSLNAALPDPVVPAGVDVRTFAPGIDEETWLALNQAVFDGHPEQGRWSPKDLRIRMCEPWFDPTGFFLAEREGRLVGFHWTKVHGASDSKRDHAHRAIGEVYVVGVAAPEHGKGLGRALTLIGLRHLRQRGLADAMLYVEADNRPAVRLYTQLGFTTWETDVMFSREPTG
jgi:mycothiol synthase